MIRKKNSKRNLEDRLSVSLLDTINAMLLGFSVEMQLEITDGLLDFTYMHIVHRSRCKSADSVLMTCYNWIAEEQGFEFVNL
jgi:hypothetical protein